ncbi:MAG TPA: SIS domain-containing protein [Alphaproteobacteria bacterium]|nr:SIS domain-containing protein [Alphaproteobacteria bacterium]
MAGFDLDDYLTRAFAEHDEVFHATQSVARVGLAVLVERCAETLSHGGKLMFFGNGGSAADAQHLATELTVRFSQDRAPLAALALTTDSSALTAIGNDLGFTQLFARQIQALGRPGDVAIAISTSGRSANVIEGLKAARALEITAAGLGGGDGGDMVGLADPLLIVPSTNTARVQEMHIMLGQMLCGALEQRLGLV